MKNNASLYTALLRNYILIGVVPLLVLGITCQQLLTHNLSKEITTKNHLLATSLVSEIETFLQEPLFLMRQVQAVLSTNARFSPETISPYLDSVISDHPFFEMIQYLDNNGKVVFVSPSDEASIGADMSRQPIFISSDRNNGPHWSQTFISTISGAPSLTISIPSNEGIAVGYLNLATISTIVGRMSNEHQLTLITDDKGTVIDDLIPEPVQQRTNLQNIASAWQGLKSTTGTFSVVLQDTEMLTSVVPVPLTGWQLIYLRHQNDAFISVTRMNVTLVIGILLTALVALFVAIIATKFTLRPLHSLIQDVQRVTDGNYTLSSASDGYREFQQLRENFTSMTETIKMREQNILSSERQYRNLIEVIPNGIQESNLHGRITFTNSAYDRIFECENGAAIGRTIWDNAINEEKKRALQSYLNHLIEKQPPPTPFFTQTLTDKGNIIDVEVD
ncbi:cache domain-containing protein [Desulfopila aestuarii]|uniref:histidine kinase n=1 Tax=Desulfopila aestuarii DSM 18488 TaxID=1121416 RepID=A0A1M7Y3B1_9BACT|nr:cache domain-containing protein [Desulfopila aestuarii]SHO46593.1 PAS domain S-box-containing protein [Desulfopila aestuarii DSM 18488]